MMNIHWRIKLVVYSKRKALKWIGAQITFYEYGESEPFYLMICQIVKVQSFVMCLKNFLIPFVYSYFLTTNHAHSLGLM